MFEADSLCDRIAVINRGKIVAEGTRAPEEPRRGGSVVEVEVFGVAEETMTRLRALNGVRAVAIEDREQVQVLTVQTDADVQLTHSILGHLDGTNVGRVTQREPTLEDAYVALVTEE